jgi:hypothetical protein
VLRRGRDGLGPTTTSKLLAAKRARLLPIWDSFVEHATGLDTIGYWWRFQYVLADDQRFLWDWLRELRSLAPNMPESIPELRILDVLLWMSVEGSRHWGAGQCISQFRGRRCRRRCRGCSAGSTQYIW